MDFSFLNQRREFLKQLAGLTTGILLPYDNINALGNIFQDKIGEKLPLRTLGKTGEKVTMLGLGGYHIGWTTEKDARETIEAALEGGVRFFDNAESYSDGLSEERYGKFLIPKYRDEIFLMTKTHTQDYNTIQKHLEGSLRRFNTDALDLWQIHSLSNPEDVDKRIENKLVDYVVEAKKTGKVRYVGFTGHQNPDAHARMLDRAGEDIFDTCQMPVNLLDAGYHASFIKQIMPRLVNNNQGILAMKTLADGRFFNKKIQENNVTWETDDPVVPGRVSIEDALNFAWSLPISVLITGAENAELIKEKITMARNFEALKENERNQLIEKVLDLSHAGNVEYYKNV